MTSRFAAKTVMSRTISAATRLNNTAEDAVFIERVKKELPFDLDRYINSRFLTYRSTKDGKRVYYMSPLIPLHVNGPTLTYAITQTFCVPNDLFVALIAREETPILSDSIALVPSEDFNTDFVRSFARQGVRVVESGLTTLEGEGSTVLSAYTFYSAAGYAPDFLVNIFEQFGFDEKTVTEIVDPAFHKEDLFVFVLTLHEHFGLLLKLDKDSGRFIVVNGGSLERAFEALIAVPYPLAAKNVLFADTLYTLPLPKVEEQMRSVGCQFKPALSDYPAIGLKDPADIFSHHNTGDYYTPIWSEEGTRWFLRLDGDFNEFCFEAINAFSNVDDRWLSYETTIPAHRITVPFSLAKGEIEKPILAKGFTMTNTEQYAEGYTVGEVLFLHKIKKKWRWHLRKVFSKKQFKRDLFWTVITDKAGNAVNYLFEVRGNVIVDGWPQKELGVKDKHLTKGHEVQPSELTYVKDKVDPDVHKAFKGHGIKHTLSGGSVKQEQNNTDLVYRAIEVYVDTMMMSVAKSGGKTAGRQNEIDRVRESVKAWQAKGSSDHAILVMLADFTRLGLLYRDWTLSTRYGVL